MEQSAHELLARIWQMVVLAALSASSCHDTGWCVQQGEPATPHTAPATAASQPLASPVTDATPSRRDAGPAVARPESPERIEAAASEARQLTAALLSGGVDRREVTSVADIRGYRLYRRGLYRQARVWFEIGVEIDPTFEPCLHNAARVAALLGDQDAARAHLAQLARLDTPMGRRFLRSLAAESPRQESREQ